METAILAAAAVGAIGLVHLSDEVWFLRLLFAGVIATPLAFAAHRLERFGPRVPLIAGSVAALVALVAVSASLPTVHDRLDPAFHWPYMLAVLAALLVPFVVPGPPFARFMRRFFEQTTIWGILCACALAALGVVMLALKELFDLRVEELWLDASIVLGCGFILVYLHRLRDDDAASRGRMPELWRRLATMIGAPFVTAMLAILAIYEIVTRVRGALPRNVLSPLIIAAGLVGFVSTLIISSVLAEDTGTGVIAPADPHRWARRWSVRLTRAFPVALLALLPMAGWALWARVDQHGITPFRAVRGMGLLCLACLSIVGTLRWARGRAALSREVPAAIIGFTLVAAFGPLSAVELSIRSQAAIMGGILDEAGAGRNVDPAENLTALAPEPRERSRRVELSRERYAELYDAMRVLRDVGGERALRRVLTGAVAVCADRWEGDACLQRLGVYERGRETPEPAAAAQTVLEAHGRFATAAGEIERIDVSRQPEQSGVDLRDGFSLAADRVVLRAGGAVVAQLSLVPLFELAEGNRPLPASTHALVRSDGTIAAELAIARLRIWQSGRQPPEAIELDAIVIWRRAP